MIQCRHMNGFKLPEIRIGNKVAKVPVFQGGMSIRVSTAPLCGAVAREGAVGIIGGSGIPPQEIIDQLHEARRISPDGIIGVNIMYVARDFMELCEASLKGGADFIISGAGFSRDLFKFGKDNHLPIISIVSSAKAAVMAEKCGADAIVVEGGEAGGHLGTRESVWKIFPEVMAAVKSKIPILPAGGITNGYEIRKAIEMGAAGVQMATRFLMSQECTVSENFKNLLKNAKKEDVVVVKSPVGMPGRAILTPFVQKMFTNSKDLFERCKVNCMKFCDHFYCIVDRLVWAIEGDIENGLFFTGANVWKMNDIPPVKEIVSRLVTEAEAQNQPSLADINNPELAQYYALHLQHQKQPELMAV